MYMEEKRKKLHEALDEACEHGLGEFNIKIKEDGDFFILDYRWKRNPSILEIQEAFEHLPSFGGLDKVDGEVTILKQLRRIKI